MLAPMPHTTDVSIVICTRNRSEHLRLTLESIDKAALVVIRKMGFSPKPTSDENMSVPLRSVDDVHRVLDELQKAGLAPGSVDVRKANLDRFTLDRLIAMLVKLNQDVEVRIEVKPRRQRHLVPA